MFYKMQKISQLSSYFYTMAFQFYKRSIPSRPNALLKSSDWWYIVLIILSLSVLGGALFQTAFVIHIFALLWFLFPLSAEFAAFSYKPISLEYWIYSISAITSLYSLYLCWHFPREFRLLLLVETGITLKKFLYNLKYHKSYLLLILFLLCVCIGWPCFGLIIAWILPLLIEYFCVNTLLNSGQAQSKKKFGNNFTALMGLEYLSLQQNFLNSLDNTVIQADLDYNIFEQEDNVYPDLDWDFGEDLDDSVYFDEFASDEDFENNDFEDSIHSFDALVTDQSIPDLHLKKKVFNLRLKNDLPDFIAVKYNNKQLLSYYKTYLLQKSNRSLEKRPVSSTISLYDNTFTDYLPVVTEYEELSDLYSENSSEEDEEDGSDEDSYSEDSEIRQDFELYADFFDESDLEDGTFELGFGDDFTAPNWYWLFFFYLSLPLWCFVNIIVSVCLFSFGIPDDWLISSRETNQYFIHYWLLFHKLDFLSIARSAWATEIWTNPITGDSYCRRDFFEGPFPINDAWSALLNADQSTISNVDLFMRQPALQNILNGRKATTAEFPWINYLPLDWQKKVLAYCDFLAPTHKERFWGALFNQDLSGSIVDKQFDVLRKKKVETFWRKFYQNET